MQFVVTAFDGTDPGAPARRAAVRDAHLAHIAPMVERGEMVVGGAVLDDAGTMVGSVVILEVPDRAAVDAWLASDPYVTGKVWERVEVRPFRVAVQRAAAPA